MLQREVLFDIWGDLYPDVSSRILENYLHTLHPYPKESNHNGEHLDWYKDAIVYSLYVDLFNHDFQGITEKLDYIHDLGVNCLWLLPILDSPMRDAGFDISDYFSIRNELLGPNDKNQYKIFGQLLKEAHNRGIKVIFDIAMNHTSDQHYWFKEARKSKSNPYRNYYIWGTDPSSYDKARIIFKGIEKSNWEFCDGEYYFHRFFNFQPDLNYRNPEVLLSMCQALLFWQDIGVDGFRVDAIPYIWKEEGTECENLPQTHLIVKFLRAILDYMKPGSLLLAEACQQPAKVVEYMGNGDECHAAYHFPLMPRMFKAIAQQSGNPIQEILSPAVTPTLPPSGQWFTFLRCHDELSLELVYVTEEERKFIHENYCLDPKWDFRLGEGISARLSELLNRDPRKIHLAYSLILTLPGTPVIYYGDEFGKLNDEAYYNEMIHLTGKDDTRFLVRGKIDWNQLEKELADPLSFSSSVNVKLKKMLKTRRQYKAFGRGSLTFSNLSGNSAGAILAYQREFGNEKILVVHNMTDQPCDLQLPATLTSGKELLQQSWSSKMTIEPYGFRWIYS
ncbi:MAG: alpha-glucosidase C-terminal domain-containing protein [Bacteroidales bacterium]|nr:alpha-glucosidase C-terminal domain-containing protein [Bacteroidales bacterium]